MITTPEALEEALGPIRAASRIGLDTEADSLHCDFEKLCLIQISVPGLDVLIDPLAKLPLQPLFEELPKHEVIIQGLDYDVRLLRRVGMEEIGSVFDTMIAARLAGLREFSLAALLGKYFDVTIAKSSQKANWARRPLPEKMTDYAVNDTRYLIALAEKLETRLTELGRLEWFWQSCNRALEATRVSRERDLESVWRISGSGDMRGRAAAMMRALWMWRDNEARTVDRPAFHIMRNDLLIDAARRFAAGESVQVAHLSGGRKRRFEEAAQKALALPESEWPRFVRTPRPRATPAQEKRFAVLREHRDKVGAKLDLDPSLLASRTVLEALSMDDAEALERLLPWQRELLEL